MPPLPELLVVAKRVRAAIEAIPSAQRTTGLRFFPDGSSSDACQLLGAYLADLGVLGLRYVRGSLGSKRDDTWIPHAWLQRSTLIIDIATDRFAHAPARVVVADPSPWHAQFKIEDSSQPADFRLYTGPGLLHVMYGRILDQAPPV